MAENKAFQGLVSQQETNYVPLSTTPAQACANCRWFIPNGYMGNTEAFCHIVAQYPEPILATGYCDRWEATPAPPEQSTDPIPVVIVEPPIEADDSQEMALPTNSKGILDYVVKGISDFLKPMVDAVQAGLDANAAELAFSVYKASNGKKYWIARHTGKWKDREKEIIANHAHDEYVDRAQRGLVPLPELWVWHKKGTRHGQADMVWKSGGFTLALGHFDETPEGDKAFEYYQKNRGKIKLSHMFHFPRNAKQGGVYHAYNTVEITTLPDGAEAFPYTSFEEITPMALTKEQEKMILDIGGQDMLNRVQTVDNKALSDTSKLDALGIESKGLDNFIGSEIPTDKAYETLKTTQDGIDIRLKAVEALPARVEALQTIVKTMSKEVQEAQGREAVALKELNTLKQQLLEYQAVAPPASRSKDTLLNEREKTLIGEAAKNAEITTSLIGMMAGEAPAVTSQ